MRSSVAPFGWFSVAYSLRLKVSRPYEADVTNRARHSVRSFRTSVLDVYSHRSAGASCSEAIGPIPRSGSLAYSGLDVITVGIQEERGIVAASALTGGSVVRPTVSEARFVKGNDGFS